MSSKPRVLILFATREGQTEKIATFLAQRIRGHHAQVTVGNVQNGAAVKSLTMEDFDLVVIGASIHVGAIEHEMQSFLNTNAETLNRLPHALFLVLMAAASNDEKHREESLDWVRKSVRKRLKVEFAEVEMIAGAVKYTRYNWFIRWIMKRISRSQGGSTDTSQDHEYTDWHQVSDYADRLFQLARDRQKNSTE